jgi:hypothetical protein
MRLSISCRVNNPETSISQNRAPTSSDQVVPPTSSNLCKFVDEHLARPVAIVGCCFDRQYLPKVPPLHRFDNNRAAHHGLT